MYAISVKSPRPRRALRWHHRFIRMIVKWIYSLRVWVSKVNDMTMFAIASGLVVVAIALGAIFIPKL